MLVLSDLGPLSILSTHLSSVSATDSTVPLVPGSSSAYDLGLRLGDFFAQLHSPRVLNSLKPESFTEFVNQGTDDLIFQTAVLPVEEHLQKFSIPDATSLFERVKQDYQRQDTIEERAFAIGDLWTGGILVDSRDGDVKKLGVIDWEFAGIGRGVNGDMAQLLADLHLLSICFPAESVSRAATSAIIQGIHRAYRSQSRINDSTWVIPASPQSVVSTFIAPPASSVAALMMRSAFILHGREMINMALWRKWSCRCCPDSTNSERPKESCLVIQEMIQKGTWFIRTAGNNEAEFITSDYWERALTDDGMIIGGLFLGD